jgi:hypothetical protein
LHGYTQDVNANSQYNDGTGYFGGAGEGINATMMYNIDYASPWSRGQWGIWDLDGDGREPALHHAGRRRHGLVHRRRGGSRHGGERPEDPRAPGDREGDEGGRPEGEGAEDSLFDEDIEALIADEILRIPDFFKLVNLNVVSGSAIVPTATVQIEMGGKTYQEAGLGTGPWMRPTRPLPK